MITLVGVLTIISGILYFLACDNIGKTLITKNELLITKIILAAGICTTSVGFALEFFK
jgi:ABC-type thiamin/hydroxymethylpyrimidine transport system permease subunit